MKNERTVGFAQNNDGSKSNSDREAISKFDDEVKKYLKEIENNIYIDTLDLKREVTVKVTNFERSLMEFVERFDKYYRDTDILDLEFRGKTEDINKTVSYINGVLKILSDKDSELENKHNDMNKYIQEIVNENLIVPNVIGKNRKFKNLAEFVNFSMMNFKELEENTSKVIEAKLLLEFQMKNNDKFKSDLENFQEYINHFKIKEVELSSIVYKLNEDVTDLLLKINNNQGNVNSNNISNSIKNGNNNYNYNKQFTSVNTKEEMPEVQVKPEELQTLQTTLEDKILLSKIELQKQIDYLETKIKKFEYKEQERNKKISDMQIVVNDVESKAIYHESSIEILKNGISDINTEIDELKKNSAVNTFHPNNGNNGNNTMTLNRLMSMKSISHLNRNNSNNNIRLDSSVKVDNYKSKINQNDNQRTYKDSINNDNNVGNVSSNRFNISSSQNKNERVYQKDNKNQLNTNNSNINQAIEGDLLNASSTINEMTITSKTNHVNSNNNSNLPLLNRNKQKQEYEINSLNKIDLIKTKIKVNDKTSNTNSSINNSPSKQSAYSQLSQNKINDRTNKQSNFDNDNNINSDDDTEDDRISIDRVKQDNITRNSLIERQKLLSVINSTFNDNEDIEVIDKKIINENSNNNANTSNKNYKANINSSLTKINAEKNNINIPRFNKHVSFNDHSNFRNNNKENNEAYEHDSNNTNIANTMNNNDANNIMNLNHNLNSANIRKDNQEDLNTNKINNNFKSSINVTTSVFPKLNTETKSISTNTINNNMSSTINKPSKAQLKSENANSNISNANNVTNTSVNTNATQKVKKQKQNSNNKTDSKAKTRTNSQQDYINPNNQYFFSTELNSNNEKLQKINDFSNNLDFDNKNLMYNKDFSANSIKIRDLSILLHDFSEIFQTFSFDVHTKIEKLNSSVKKLLKYNNVSVFRLMNIFEDLYTVCLKTQVVSVDSLTYAKDQLKKNFNNSRSMLNLTDYIDDMFNINNVNVTNNANLKHDSIDLNQTKESYYENYEIKSKMNKTNHSFFNANPTKKVVINNNPELMEIFNGNDTRTQKFFNLTAKESVFQGLNNNSMKISKIFFNGTGEMKFNPNGTKSTFLFNKKSNISMNKDKDSRFAMENILGVVGRAKSQSNIRNKIKNKN